MTNTSPNQDAEQAKRKKRNPNDFVIACKPSDIWLTIGGDK